MSDIGTGLPALMPKKSLFAKKDEGSENRSELKNRIFALLKSFFDKYFGICGFEEDDARTEEKHGQNIVDLSDSKSIIAEAESVRELHEYKNVADKQAKYSARK